MMLLKTSTSKPKNTWTDGRLKCATVSCRFQKIKKEPIHMFIFTYLYICIYTSTVYILNMGKLSNRLSLFKTIHFNLFIYKTLRLAGLAI